MKKVGSRREASAVDDALVRVSDTEYRRFCTEASEKGLRENHSKTYSGTIGVFCQAFFGITEAAESNLPRRTLAGCHLSGFWQSGSGIV